MYAPSSPKTPLLTSNILPMPCVSLPLGRTRRRPFDSMTERLWASSLLPFTHHHLYTHYTKSHLSLSLPLHYLNIYISILGRRKELPLYLTQHETFAGGMHLMSLNFKCGNINNQIRGGREEKKRQRHGRLLEGRHCSLAPAFLLPPSLLLSKAVIPTHLPASFSPSPPLPKSIKLSSLPVGGRLSACLPASVRQQSQASLWRNRTPQSFCLFLLLLLGWVLGAGREGGGGEEAKLRPTPAPPYLSLLSPHLGTSMHTFQNCFCLYVLLVCGDTCCGKTHTALRHGSWGGRLGEETSSLLEEKKMAVEEGEEEGRKERGGMACLGSLHLPTYHRQAVW